MKRHNVLIIIMSSLFISSCGLIEKFKTPNEQAAESATNTTDDLFSKSMNDAPLEIKNDAPTNINNVISEVDKNSTNANQAKEIESIPEIISDSADISNEKRTTKNYKVQKGETLMLISFKIYGDISKWKELKKLNNLSSNSSLLAKMNIKYYEPNKPFLWNPEGTPRMIKNGDTLGKISNAVYQTTDKWRSIWENNKQLIKNPNVIYSGFTIYYKENKLANLKNDSLDTNQEDQTTETQSSTTRFKQ